MNVIPDPIPCLIVLPQAWGSLAMALSEQPLNESAS